MIKKECCLDRASRYYGGGGGGTDINQSPGGFRFWGDDKRGEQKDIGKGYDFNIGRFNEFRDTDPLLSMATSGVQDFWKQLPDMLAQFPGFQKEITGAQGDIKGYQGQLGGVFDQMSKLFGQIPGLQNQIQGYQGQLGDLYRKTGSMIPGIRQDIGKFQGQLGGLFNQLGQQGQTLGGWLNAPGGPQGIISSGGALTPGLLRNAQQQSLALQERAGTAHTSGGLAHTVLDSEAAREARLSRAQQQGQSFLNQQSNIYGQQAGVTGQGAGLTGLGTQLISGLLGQQGGLVGQGMQGTGMLGNLLSLGQNISQGMAGVTGQGAGLAQMIAALTGQKAGLLQQQQGLQTGALNQALGVGNAAVSQFGGLTNPILSYMQGIFGGNQQAAIQQAQINAQTGAAHDAKTADIIAGGLNAVGGIAGGAAMSDKRIKTKIKATGLKTTEGVPIKTFEYKTRPGVPFIGVVAQDVEKKRPDAVITDPLSGLKMVDFWKFKGPMVELGKEK